MWIYVCICIYIYIIRMIIYVNKLNMHSKDYILYVCTHYILHVVYVHVCDMPDVIQLHCHYGDPMFRSQPRRACAPALDLTCFWSHRRCPVDVPTHHAHAELQRAQKAPNPQSWQAAANGFDPHASAESPTFCSSLPCQNIARDGMLSLHGKENLSPLKSTMLLME